MQDNVFTTFAPELVLELLETERASFLPSWLIQAE